MTTEPAKESVWYLAVFGRCEISHFESPEDLDAFMRAEMRQAGIDTSRMRSSERLQDAYITHIHIRCEGPVEWGEASVEPPAKRRKRRRQARADGTTMDLDVRADAQPIVAGTPDQA